MAEKRKPRSDAIDSNQQLWSADLDPMIKTQEANQPIQEQTINSADQKIVEVSGKATQHWDKLEQVFEERVARALDRLGIPTNKDIKKLTARIDQLSATIQQLTTQPSGIKTASSSRAIRARKPA